MTRTLRLTIVLAMGLALFTAAPALAGYRVVRTVGKPGGVENEYNDPSGLTLDGHQHLFVADTLNNRIVKTDASSGDYMLDWHTSALPYVTSLGTPFTVSADERGNIWVLDASGHPQAFGPNGEVIGELPLSGPGIVSSATADLHGHVFVARFDNYDLPGYPYVFGFPGYGQTYTIANGNLVNNIGIGPNRIIGTVAFGPHHHMYALDAIANTVIDVDLGGTTAPATWTAPQGADAFTALGGVDTDQYGFVYVTESGRGRVDKLTPDGRLVSTMRADAGTVGAFTPEGIAVARTGEVWVTDSTNDRLVEFKPNAPETIVDTPKRGIETNTRSPQIHVSSDVKGAAFRCRVDGGKITVCGADGVVRLHFDGDGFHLLTVRAVDRHGVRDLSPARVPIEVDTRKPVLTGASYTFKVGTQVIVNSSVDGGIPIGVSWAPARDSVTKGHDMRYELLASYDASAFGPFSTTEQFSASTHRETFVIAGVKTAFRVAARDLAGNVGNRDITPPARVVVHQDSDPALTYTGTTLPIDTTADPEAWGGTARTLEPGATAHFSGKNHGIAVVMRKQDGPARRAKICLANGANRCKTVDLGGGAGERQIVFGRMLNQGTHTLDITAIDEVTLDAIVTLKG